MKKQFTTRARCCGSCLRWRGVEYYNSHGHCALGLGESDIQGDETFDAMAKRLGPQTFPFRVCDAHEMRDEEWPDSDWDRTTQPRPAKGTSLGYGEFRPRVPGARR